MSAFLDQINASVCYCQTYYINDQDVTEGEFMPCDAMIKQLTAHFAGIRLQDDGRGGPVFDDIRTAANFLYGGKMPFETERVLLTDFSLTHGTLPISDSAVMVCMYPEIGIVSIMVNLTLRGATTDQMVFLRHMQGGAEQLTQTGKDGSVQMLSVSQVTAAVADVLGVSVHKSQSAYTLEINAFGEYYDVEVLRNEQPLRLYGMLVGDEGWAYVPVELARKRLCENTWTSRRHVLIAAFSTSFLMINLYDSPMAQAYSAHQVRFFTEYYGDKNVYFDLKCVFAGVNHGLLFATETGMIISTFSQSILDRQGNYQNGQQGSFRKSIQGIKAFRRQVILTLNRLENLQISEMGELQLLVLESLRINPIIDRLKYLLELMESEMDLMYSTRTNMLVNLIAIISLIFSMLEVFGVFFTH